MADRAFKADTLRSVAFGSITDSYANLGSSLGNPSQIMVLKNTSDALLFVSEDGSNDHYELAAGTSFIYNFQGNARGGDQGVKAQGTQFQVKGVGGSLPTSGKIVLEIQYL